MSVSTFNTYLDVFLFDNEIEWQMKQIEKARSREMQIRWTGKDSSRELVKQVPEDTKGQREQ